MKNRFLLVGICLLALSQISFSSLSKPIIDYRIKAALIPEEKAVRGQEVLTWLNDSDEFIGELQFHLYLNAFKNNRSTFMKESLGTHRGFPSDKKNWGYIEVKTLQIENGADLMPDFEYIQPDDGNKDDQTVARVLLPEPVPPHEKITIFIEFYAKLPKVFARSGFYDDFFMVAQWFPKIGVLRDGVWNCHQYHSSSEFFADFGTYEVEITVPKKYVVGACGKRIKEVKNPDGTMTYTHYQEDIHDFAWAACPDFVEFKEKYSLKEPKVETEIILLIHRSHLNQKERYLSSLKNGIEFYSQNYGPYPYQTITLIDPAPRAYGAGGMEYPTLFTSMSFHWMPKWLYITEMVTIHEFGHNYWYGMIGSNEFEEAWLDEGFNTYSEIKAMARYYGEDSSQVNLSWLKVSDLVSQRFQLIGSGKMDPIIKKSWEYYSGGSYSLNSYNKAALTLLTLENYLGKEKMSEIMKSYFERWKFKHPTTEDFIAVAEEVSGLDLGWFFDQFLYSPDKLDYAIGALKSDPLKEAEGIFGGEVREVEEKKKKEEAGKEKYYRNEVVVIRKGELIFPQEILIRFENGKEIREEWDGKDRWKRFIYVRPSRVKYAKIDPDNKILIDTNFLNNSMTIEENETSLLKWALGCMSRFQDILSFIAL